MTDVRELIGAMDERGTRRAIVAVAGLALLLAANYYLRHSLEESDRRIYAFFPYFYPEQTRAVFSAGYPLWKLFLPLREFTGSWTTTSLVLTHVVETWIGGGATWCLFNLLLIASSFATAWLLFRSLLFSFTFAICMGFGTQLYHTYAVTGTVGAVLILIYYEWLLLSAWRVVDAAPRYGWRALFVVALLTAALSYEGWLDLAAFFWVGGLFGAVILWRRGESARLRRLAAIVGTVTAVAVVYVYVKLHAGYGQTPGSESDVVFNYPVLAPAVEDVITNVFTGWYMVVTNFLPPIVTFSTSLRLIGAEQLIQLQHGYHEPFQYLVPMQYVFLWRFYAGVAAVLLVGGVWRLSRRAYAHADGESSALALFGMMAMVAGPTHALVKFRPMTSTPVLTYHVLVGVLGISLLISGGVLAAARRLPVRTTAVLVTLVWAALFYSALARPAMLSQMAAQAGLGDYLYPDPWRTLAGKLHLPPRIVAPPAAYRLEPFRETGHGRDFHEMLPPMPNALPSPSTWSAERGVVVTATPAHGVRVDGDDSETSYQIVSPPVVVPPGRTVLLRVNGRVDAGRVCLGVLDASQQRWLMAPDGTQPEYRFETGDQQRVFVVVANCNLQPAGNARSQFVVHAVTYGLLETAPR